MVNKHDQFEGFILERLSRGVMKSQIARDLVELGVASTPDQLSRWLKRRADRILANAGLVDPVNAGPLATPNPPATVKSPPAAPAAPAHQEAPPKPATAAPVADFRKRGTLNIDIGNEDDLIAERKRQDPLGLLSKNLNP